jgi:hypothetical protein
VLLFPKHPAREVLRFAAGVRLYTVEIGIFSAFSNVSVCCKHSRGVLMNNFYIDYKNYFILIILVYRLAAGMLSLSKQIIT